MYKIGLQGMPPEFTGYFSSNNQNIKPAYLCAFALAKNHPARASYSYTKVTT